MPDKQIVDFFTFESPFLMALQRKKRKW